MKTTFVLFYVLITLSTSVIGQDRETKLKIALIKGTSPEQATKQQLLNLIQKYDISKWIYTDSIHVEDGMNVIPHSHPVLTLNTRHIKDDELLLATFIHEQFHWYLDLMPKESKAIYQELIKIFPQVPNTFPAANSDKESTYYHLVVCALEYISLKELLGELKARQLIDFWATDHYTWIYRTVLDQTQVINKVLKKHQLLPIQPNTAKYQLFK